VDDRQSARLSGRRCDRRLLSPVIRPRDCLPGFARRGRTGSRVRRAGCGRLGCEAEGSGVGDCPAVRVEVPRVRPIVYFDETRHPAPFSVRKALSGKRIMLIGVTGFIGKVWLANTLLDLPEIGKLYLLIRRQKSSPAQARFEK